MSEEPLQPVPPRANPHFTGHEGAVRAFTEAHASGRLHHAWLITGPRGVGKATLAYRLARGLLADAGGREAGLFGEETPALNLDMDAEDSVFRKVASGAHPGLVNVERTVNEKTGKLRRDIIIDDIRRLTHFFTTTAAHGGWRVAIIDTADDMNRNAANAVLKTLEEPPKHAILFLVSHMPGRLLPTIRSRCRRLALSPLPDEQVLRALKLQPALAEGEKTAEESSLENVARLGQGSPGRAMELLGGGLRAWGRVMDIYVGLPRVRPVLMHDIAGFYADRKREREAEIFLDMFTGFPADVLRAEATGAALRGIDEREETARKAMMKEGALDEWLALTDKMRDLRGRADALNMDRRQLMLTLFELLDDSLAA